MNFSLRNPLVIGIIVSLGGFVFGFDASVISGVVGYATDEFVLSVWQQGLLVSSAAMATVVATVTIVPLSDSFGRKNMLIAVAALYLISAIGSALAPTFETLVVARAIGGLAFGSLMITPIYVAEIAPPARRGFMVAVNQMNIVVGLSAAYFSNYALVRLSGSPAAWVQTLGISADTWRWMLGVEILPAAAWLLLLFSVPESPRWLLVKNRPDEARRVFAKLFAPAEAAAAISAVQQGLAEGTGRPDRSTIRKLLDPRLRLVLLVGLIVAVAQQATGINAVFFYATSIFELSGVGKNAAFVQAVWVGLINVVFTVVAMMLIDRLGRKPLLLGGLMGIILSLSMVAFGFYKASYRIESTDLPALAPHLDATRLQGLVGRTFARDTVFKRAVGEALGDSLTSARQSAVIRSAIKINPSLVLFGILGFVASFAISLGPVMWVVLSEIFPNTVRASAMALVSLANAATSWLVQFVFPWELDTLGATSAFLIFTACAVFGLFMVARYVPETKGLSLEELEWKFTRAGKAGS